MALTRNVFAGIASAGVSTAVGILVVPLYVRFLGIEAYGLIGFFTTTSALLQVFDLGLTPTLNREVARASATGEVRSAAPLLHSLAVVFWGVALILGGGIAAAAPALANGWLQARELPPETLERAVTLIGVVIACRWPTGLYVGALMGAERLVLASALAIGSTVLASLGAVVVLALVSPTVEAFFLWQAAAGLAYAFATRTAAWRVVGRPAGLRFDAGELRRVWRFSLAMSAIALYAVVFTQLDKLLLSRLVPLDQFGHYMMAAMVASGLYLLIMPVFNATYPRFSALVASGDTAQLAALYRGGTRALLAGVFPLAVLLALGSEDLVRLWMRDAALAGSVAPLIALLATGSALHAVMFLPYALQLAYGMTRLPLVINTILIVVLVPMLVALALAYGALGGAVAWVVLQALYVAIGTFLTHRHILRGTGTAWLTRDVGIPAAISVTAFGIGYEVLRRLAAGAPARLAVALALAAIAAAAIVASSGTLRTTASATIHGAFRAMFKVRTP